MSHRVNSVAKMAEVSVENGVEIDVRTYQGHLVLAHDPFDCGENFETWLKCYRHKILVINVKEEGLEKAIEAAIAQASPKIDYLFLDQSFPSIAGRLSGGFTDSMVRVSDYESIQTLENLPCPPAWVWVDTFNKGGLRKIDLNYLHRNYKMMVVSPELQGREFQEEAVSMLSQFSDLGFLPDAICTKRSDDWKRLIRTSPLDK